MYSEWKSRQTGFIIFLIFLLAGLKTINNSEIECAGPSPFPKLPSHRTLITLYIVSFLLTKLVWRTRFLLERISCIWISFIMNLKLFFFLWMAFRVNELDTKKGFTMEWIDFGDNYVFGLEPMFIVAIVAVIGLGIYFFSRRNIEWSLKYFTGTLNGWGHPGRWPFIFPA